MYVMCTIYVYIHIYIYMYIYKWILGHVGGGRLRLTLNRGSYRQHTNKHLCTHIRVCMGSCAKSVLEHTFLSQRHRRNNHRHIYIYTYIYM